MCQNFYNISLTVIPEFGRKINLSHEFLLNHDKNSRRINQILFSALFFWGGGGLGNADLKREFLEAISKAAKLNGLDLNRFFIAWERNFIFLRLIAFNLKFSVS